jgi:hypothetical protein
VTLADQRDARWQATLDGRRLEARTYDGWAQAFVLPPAEGGRLVVRYDDGNRQRLLWLQGAALLLAIILALPSVRRVEDVDEATAPADVAPERVGQVDDTVAAR